MSMKVPFVALFLVLAGYSGSAGTADTGGNAGATEAASERYMGTRSNVNATWSGATSSSIMLEPRHARLRTKEELGLPRWMPAVEGSLDDPPIVLRQAETSLPCVALGGPVPLIENEARARWTPSA
jgi:hypothetical protein